MSGVSAFERGEGRDIKLFFCFAHGPVKKSDHATDRRRASEGMCGFRVHPASSSRGGSRGSGARVASIASRAGPLARRDGRRRREARDPLDAPRGVDDASFLYVAERPQAHRPEVALEHGAVPHRALVRDVGVADERGVGGDPRVRGDGGHAVAQRVLLARPVVQFVLHRVAVVARRTRARQGGERPDHARGRELRLRGAAEGSRGAGQGVAEHHGDRTEADVESSAARRREWRTSRACDGTRAEKKPANREFSTFRMSAQSAGSLVVAPLSELFSLWFSAPRFAPKLRILPWWQSETGHA